MTSSEILKYIKSKNISEELYSKLKFILTNADLVKFAKEKPLPEINENAIEYAFFFVEETKETMPSYKYWARKGCTRQQQLDGVKVWYPRKWIVPKIVQRWFDYYNGK